MKSMLLACFLIRKLTSTKRTSSSWPTPMSTCRHSHSIGAVFGGRAIELAGRVVTPHLQGRGIGSTLLRTFVDTYPTQFLTTYTRNPAVLRMIRSVAGEIYPLDPDEELQNMANEMRYASFDPSTTATYHLKRYGETGLFRGFDPAERPCESSEPLKCRFSGLMSARNALVIAARVRRSA